MKQNWQIYSILFHIKGRANMEFNNETLELIKQRDNFEKSLRQLVYGSIEIRKKTNNRYVYVHYREDGIALSKYVGEYSEELCNVILQNTIKAKELKKNVKQLTKRLKELGYTETELSEKVSLNIDFAKSRLVQTVYRQAVLEGIATTYADTETIIEGGKVSGVTADDVIKVINLKRAWEFLLNKDVILSETNFSCYAK